MDLLKARKLTVYFICLVIALIAFYDVFIIYKSGSEGSISMQLIEWSYRYPAFTFLFGFTAGHIFWRVKDNQITKRLFKR